MTLQAGQLFIPGSPLELRDDLLADFRLEAIKYSVTQPAVTPGTDNWFFFTAVANAGYLQYSNIATVRPAITPLNATGEDLENWRIALGLPIVRPSSAAGKLTVTITGGSTVTFPDGLQFLYPSGLRGQVSGTQMGILDEQDVDVIAVDTGAATNLDSGTAVRWVGAPFNVANAARVSVNGPLTGGTDTETEDRKRERVLNRLRNTPAGGNWGHLREIAFNALASVQQPYVYPGLGGPSSDKVTILKAFDRTRNDYHRAFQSGAVSIVRNAIQSEFSTGDEHVVGTVDELACDLTFQLNLPASSLSGGSGLGWVDQRPWPPVGSGTNVAVSATSSSTAITVNAVTATAPVVGQTHVMWWSPVSMKMLTSLVTAVSGSSGAWTVTLDKPFVDALGNVVSVGDFISPAASNGEQYGDTFINLMESLGCGENTADVNRLPRSARHPFVGEGPDISITNQFLKGFLAAHSEIINGALSYVPTPTPTVPSLVSSNPMVLVPRNFGIQVMP
jgi:uncharacterized phage protein gp47/JayE